MESGFNRHFKLGYISNISFKWVNAVPFWVYEYFITIPTSYLLNLSVTKFSSEFLSDPLILYTVQTFTATLKAQIKGYLAGSYNFYSNSITDKILGY